MSLAVARLLVFGTSAVVLVLEILAGRLMAPYLGVTLETFTGIIGVVLAGIALGAWAGGVSADRVDPARLLGPLLVAGGASALASPAIVDAIGPTLGGDGPLQIIWLTSVAFLVPSILLSAVPPIVIKLRLRSIEETGTVVGSFSALGTIGALVGTFVTGFILIAAAPSRPVVITIGIGTVLAGMVALARTRRWQAVAGSVAAVLVATVALAVVPGPCDEETKYYCVSVRADDTRPSGRVLVLDTLRHSYVDLDDPTHLEFRYTKLMADAVATLPPGPLDALYLGGGGFTLPVHLREVRPGSTADVLEIDPDLIELAADEFGVEFDDGLSAEAGDARLALPSRADDAYDVVLGDAFGSLSVPWHLTTVEFVSELRRVLRPGGLYVVNLIDYPPADFARAETATLLEVFDDVAVVAPADYLTGERGGNFIVVAAVDGTIDRAALAATIDARGGGEVVTDPAGTVEFAGDARPLTDDFAPVDQLLSRP